MPALDANGGEWSRRGRLNDPTDEAALLAPAREHNRERLKRGARLVVDELV